MHLTEEVVTFTSRVYRYLWGARLQDIYAGFSLNPTRMSENLPDEGGEMLQARAADTDGDALGPL